MTSQSPPATPDESHSEVGLGAQMISIEHVQCGIGIPSWLTDILHDESETRLLLIHSSEAARSQALERLRRLTGKPIESSLHLTVERLIEALHRDLRLAAMMPDDGSTALLVHMACCEAAANLAFPIIHPDPQRVWPRSRSERLTSLHRALAEEGGGFGWDEDPGAREFDGVLQGLEEKVERSHPNRRLLTLLSRLQEWARRSQTPFTLANLDGVIVLDQTPSLSELRRSLLRSLSQFVHVHQVSHGGLFRLGEHGAWLEDIEPCRTPGSLPRFVAGNNRDPWRVPAEVGWNPTSSSVHRVKLGRSVHDIDATLALLAAFESEGGGSVIIADPAVESRRGLWNKALAERGWSISAPSVPLRAEPSIHWVLALAGLAHGEEAWSMQSLRSLAVQDTLPMHQTWLEAGPHPVDERLRPIAHARILEDVARRHHILGGPGALERWLFALKTWRPDSLQAGVEGLEEMLEETRWWFRSLAEWLHPLMGMEDRRALDEAGPILSNCGEGEIALPLPVQPVDGDAWIHSLLDSINWTELTSRSDAGIAGLQKMTDLLTRSSRLLQTAGYALPEDGLEWVESIEAMVDDSSIIQSQPEGEVRILTPSAALGCSAELVILAGMSSTQWPMRSANVPWLDTEARLDLGILRPDDPLRDSRHFFRHLLNCAETVVVLDPEDDPTSQPAGPLSEWLSNLTIAERISVAAPPPFLSEDAWDENLLERGWDLVTATDEEPQRLSHRTASLSVEDGDVRSGISGKRPRHLRQAAGLALVEARDSARSPLASGSISAGWAELQMRDRLAREPENVEVHEAWMLNTSHHRLVSLKSQKLNPGKKWPKRLDPDLRNADRWPLLSSRLSVNSRSIITDPRPLAPHPLGVPAHDHRHGEDSNLRLAERIWSASRLKTWMECPRKGWLDRRLRATGIDDLREDLDARVRGSLYHDTLAHLIAERLGFQVGEVRLNPTPANLAALGEDPTLLMGDLVSILVNESPWLTRHDAVAAQHRRELLGMSRDEFLSHIENPTRLPLQGSIGRFLEAELKLKTGGILALEAPLLDVESDSGGLMIEVGETPEGDAAIGSICVTGRIDRVEVLPQGGDSKWVNPSGSEEVCPLDLNGDSEWIPRRLIVIRDLKTVRGPESKDVGNRHRAALFEEVQLALYARAWEVMNPGDMVVGVGITEAGETVTHHLEYDGTILSSAQVDDLGEASQRCENMFRRPSEGKNPKSNAFRAWMRQRLTVAVNTTLRAGRGEVRPTPSKEACEYCSVKAACGLGSIFGGEK